MSGGCAVVCHETHNNGFRLQAQLATPPAWRVEASEAELAALRRALEEQKEETERVRVKCKDQMEEMEHEVELYVEMVDEMKRELGAR